MIMMMNGLHRGETGSWTRTSDCRSYSFCSNPMKWCLSKFLFHVLLFKVFSRFLFSGESGAVYRYIFVNFHIFFVSSNFYLSQFFCTALAFSAVTNDFGVNHTGFTQAYIIIFFFLLYNKYRTEDNTNRGMLKNRMLGCSVDPRSVSHRWPLNDLAVEMGQQPQGWEYAISVPQWFCTTLIR